VNTQAQQSAAGAVNTRHPEIAKITTMARAIAFTLGFEPQPGKAVPRPATARLPAFTRVSTPRCERRVHTCSHPSIEGVNGCTGRGWTAPTPAFLASDYCHDWSPADDR
jgi:hypothetical protein